MLILIAPVVLFGTASALLALRYAKPGFRFGWLWAVGATALAWLSVWLWQPQLPLSVVLPLWQPTDFLADTPSFSADSYAWLYALSLIALVLALLLTAPARRGFPGPSDWITSLGLTGLGLLAVTADNPLTLVLIWAALDLVELVAILRSADGPQSGKHAIAVFSIRAGGIALLLLAQVIGSQPGKITHLVSMPPGAGLLLLVAAAMRLGVLAVPLPYDTATSLGRGIGTTLRLVSAAASLVLLSRIPPLSLASSFTPLLLIVCAVVALRAGWMWLRAPDDIVGRQSWIIGLASLSLASALRGNPLGAAAWGVALILAGGTLFLSSVQETWLNRLLLIGAWTLSALPFSLTSAVWRNGGGALDLVLPAFIVAQALLIAGFVRHASRPSIEVTLASQPAWVKRAYPAGILLLLVLQILLGLWGREGALQVGMWTAGAVASILSLGFLWALSRTPALNLSTVHAPAAASNWVRDRLLALIKGIYLALSSMVQMITRVLESEAGIMWSILFLVLFISLIVGRNP
jgi:hypothetical protein